MIPDPDGVTYATLKQQVDYIIKERLRHFRGCKTSTAISLGISRSTLVRRLKKMGWKHGNR